MKTPKCENIPSDFVIVYSELKGSVTAVTLQLLDFEPCRGQEGQCLSRVPVNDTAGVGFRAERTL